MATMRRVRKLKPTVNAARKGKSATWLPMNVNPRVGLTSTRLGGDIQAGLLPLTGIVDIGTTSEITGSVLGLLRDTSVVDRAIGTIETINATGIETIGGATTETDATGEKGVGVIAETATGRTDTALIATANRTMASKPTLTSSRGRTSQSGRPLHLLATSPTLEKSSSGMASSGCLEVERSFNSTPFKRRLMTR